MRILFNNDSVSPMVSIILCDWSCRESFHAFHYLNNQTVPRDQYEVIWIEYYSRRPPEIEGWVKECESLGKPPIVDKWIVMGMPDNVYYHKHLMYNIGIVESKGDIVTFCDSDAIFAPTFVESIIKSFEEDRNIVLHLDEVRNTKRKFYPFNYPLIDNVLSRGCINWKEGKTTGLLDKEDPLHTLNYGACMCALHEDLINIGGADEHIDYLGHICGPYEMTFRLINAGKKEVWHQKEFLYHIWHPGTDGRGNYLGPHDSYNMSTTALGILTRGRIMPLVENPAIEMIRLKEDDIIYEPIIFQAIPELDIRDWSVEKLGQYYKSFWKLENIISHPRVTLLIMNVFFKMLIKQFYMKVTKISRKPKFISNILITIYDTYGFLKNMTHYNVHILKRCNNCITRLTSDNIKEFAVYGTGDVAEVLYIFTLNSSVKINAIYSYTEGKKFFNLNVMSVEAIKDYKGKVVIAGLTGVEERIEILKKVGIKTKNIVIL